MVDIRPPLDEAVTALELASAKSPTKPLLILFESGCVDVRQIVGEHLELFFLCHSTGEYGIDGSIHRCVRSSRSDVLLGS